MPDIQTAPTLTTLVGELSQKPERGERLEKVFRFSASPLRDGRYVHWDTLRHRTPPEDLTHREWWLAIKMARARFSERYP